MSDTPCLSGISVGEDGRVDPRGLKWVIVWQRSHCDWPNFTWECYTDVPVTLFAYVGCKPPWKKAGTHVKRGVVSFHDPHVYFPYQFIICQTESGLTTHHTFTWEVPNQDGIFGPGPPGDNVLFWWRCGGRTSKLVLPTAPIWTASRSPFYNWKCPEPPTPVWQGQCWHELDYGVGIDGNTAVAWTFVPQVNYNLAHLIMQGYHDDRPGKLDAEITVTLAPIIGDVMQPGIASCVFNTADLPGIGGGWGDLQLDLGPVLLSAGQEYGVQFPPGICGSFDCWYRIRTSWVSPPINANRGMGSNDCGLTWWRIITGDYMYFHGKFYKFE